MITAMITMVSPLLLIPLWPVFGPDDDSSGGNESHALGDEVGETTPDGWTFDGSVPYGGLCELIMDDENRIVSFLEEVAIRTYDSETG